MAANETHKLPEPISVDQNRLIENVYPQEPAGGADTASRTEAEGYLRDRYFKRPNGGRPPQLYDRYYEKSVVRFKKPEYWLFGGLIGKGNFKRSLAVSAASLLLVNAYVNRDKTEDAILHDDNSPEAVAGSRQQVRHLPRVHIPGLEVSKAESFRNDVGVETPRPKLNHLLADLQNLRAQGFTVKRADVYGVASDEYLAAAGYGLEVANSENHQLATIRGRNLKNDLTAQASREGIELPPIKLNIKEPLLTKEEHRALKSAAVQYGYRDEGAILNQYDIAPQKLPPAVRDYLDTYIGDNRGSSIVLRAELNGVDFPIVVPAESAAPDDDDPWRFLPLFLPPIPLRFLKRGKKLKKKTEIIPGVEGDDEWMRIYREALNEDGTLKPEAWAYTRKYQALLREGRIQDVVHASFKDQTGEERSIRVMFIDHTPSADTLEGFGELLVSLAQAQEGKVSDFLNAVAVFPSENAGGAEVGNNPKQIGMGIDIQDERDILGTAFPGIGLVEMHMDTGSLPGEIDQFMGPMWVFAHEALGHFTDLNGDKPRLIPLDEVRREYYLNSQWANSAGAHYDQLVREELTQARQWSARRGLQTLIGSVLRVDNVIDDEDPRLHEARQIRVENRFPTRYSSSKPGELYAESAAQATTGIAIPFTEQTDFVGEHPSDPRFATGYFIGRRLFDHLAERMGLRRYEDNGTIGPKDGPGAEWSVNRGDIEQLKADPELYGLAESSRLWQFRPIAHKDVLHILVRARHSKRTR